MHTSGGDKQDLSWRALLILAWPIVLARSSEAVIAFADALMIAPIGEDAVAAVTTGAVNVFTITTFPFGLVLIVQSFAAQLHVKGDHAAARRYGYYGLLVAALSMLFGLLLIPVLGPILSVFPYDAPVRAAMIDYLSIRLLGLGALVGLEALGGWYGGLGVTRLHMQAGLLSMVLNVVLNALLIEGRFGLPALGVIGAAWASLIASFIGFAFIAVFFTNGWALEVSARVSAGRLRLAEWWRMLRFGIPSGLNFFLEMAAFAIFINAVVADLGTSALAAMMVVFSVNSVSFMPAFGLSTAGAILTGQAIGAGRKDEVALVVQRTLLITVSWQMVVGLSYLAAPEVIVGWFAPPGDSPSLVAIGATMLMLSAAWQQFDAAAIVLSEALRAAGD
ncbi:MAG: MATE family efflux transporter, partial [Myxococcota bacterium]